MANRIFNDVQQWSDDDGTPLNGGKITFYEPGTVTLKDTYTDSSISTAHANPVILDSNGRPTSPIWLNGEYKYKVTTSADVAVGLTIDNLNKSTASTVETGLLVTNGSFEVDTNSDGQPDSWTISPLTAATIAIDTTDSAKGKNSLLFTSGGNGGGTATSNRFDVTKGGVIKVIFTHKSSAVNVLTKIDIKTYDKDDILISTIPVYTNASSNPASYSTENLSVTADATAVTAELVITGIDAAGTTITAGTTTNMDGISVISYDTSVSKIVIEAAQLTTSGTTIDFTNIPSWAKRITLTFDNVSCAASGSTRLTIGHSGGLETTGYDYSYHAIDQLGTSTVSSVDSSAYWLGVSTGISTGYIRGRAVIENITGNDWIYTTNMSARDPATSTDIWISNGTKSLSGTLDRLRYTTTSTFDAGQVSIIYEG